MSKLVTSDNLKAYHSELAEHLQLLERDKAYSVGDTVKYDGLTLKCTIAGNTDVNKVDYSSIDIGDTIVDGTVTFTVIDPNSMWYEEDKFYMVDDIVIYNDKFYKCITAHTATATFDTAKWSEISAGGSGGGISTYTTGISYSAGDLVIKDNVLYKANTTTSTTWVDSEWDLIGTTFNTTSAYAQKIVTGVVAPYEMLLQVGDSNYCKPPIDVLKKTGGSSNTTLTLENYNNASAYTGTSDFLKIANSKAKLYNYKEYPITPQTLSTIDIGVSDEIDFSEFYGNVEPPDSNTLALLHFDNNIIDEVGNIWLETRILAYANGKFDKAADNSESNKMLYTTSTSLLNFINSDYTIEWFWKLDSVPNMAVIASGGLNYWEFWSQGNSVRLGIRGVATYINFTVNMSNYVDSNWHHFAFVRNNDDYYLFIDGTLIDTTTSSQSYPQFASLYILGDPNSAIGEVMYGYIDEFRISNIARWTEDFTPPTQPYARPNYNISSLEVN